jgi:hypothetical protein
MLKLAGGGEGWAALQDIGEPAVMPRSTPFAIADRETSFVSPTVSVMEPSWLVGFIPDGRGLRRRGKDTFEEVRTDVSFRSS